MSAIIDKIVKKAIDKARQSKYLQSVFEKPIALDELPVMGEFKDSHGNEFKLREGLRSKVKPGWQKAVSESQPVIDQEGLERFKSNGYISIDRLLPVLKAHGYKLENCDVLEVGCHSGACSFALAESGARSVIGTEFNGYKVSSVTQEGEQSALVDVDDYLSDIRNRLVTLYRGADTVRFINDDICNSAVEPSSVDVICSWDVLEHVHNYQGAFEGMYRLLKPGGIMIHEYNSFFSLNGGHSNCTLDFPWGHVRLNDEDFQRYVREFRPEEEDSAMAFFRSGLNRMTRSQLIGSLKEANFEIRSIIPFSREQHIRMVDRDVLEQCRKNYPDMEMGDLCSPRTLVIATKTI